MKKIVTTTLLLGYITVVAAQNHVRWSYSTKKIADKAYEVHITAIIDNGWYIYSQIQPTDAIALPSKIQFTRNPLIELKGITKEVGNRELHENKDIGISDYQYAATVDFVQTIQLNADTKTNINGTIMFMACTAEQCLPPTTLPFSVQLK